MANSTITSSDDGFDAEFNFIWKIKNFSHCLPSKCVRSPPFTVESMDKTRWCLQLWPKRNTNGAYLEYYLTREADKSEPRVIRVAFELSFLDCYGIQLVKKKHEAAFKKDEFKGFTEFVEQAVVYTHRKYEYLPGNILTACCRMKRIGGERQKPVFCSAVSIIGVERSSFHWNIRDFSKIRPGMLRSIRKRNPYIKVELSLTDKTEEALQFEISHAHVHKPNLINCEISVINASEETVYSKKSSKYLEGKVMKFPKFLKKSQLTAEDNVCLQNDVLVLKCDISVSLGVISSVMDGYRSSSLEDEESSSSGNEDFSSTTCEIISDIRQERDGLKRVLKEEGNIEEVKTKQILEDSSSRVNESPISAQNEQTYSTENEIVDGLGNIKPSFYNEVSYSTENEDCSSTESGIIQKIRQETGTLKTTLKEVEKVEEMKAKEIVGKFLHEDSSSSVNESSFTAENEESCSTVDETISGIIYKSFSIEDILTTGSMNNEIKRIYQDGTFSDINLTVENETFLVHKLILSLKSPKFKEMFMSNLSKRSIQLSDLDPQTLRDLLGFIYTSNVENMTWEKAKKLFSAAESYQVTSLKHVCLKFMKENINESNACSVLIFAIEQQNEELKQLASEFIVNHGKTIMTTKVWNEFAKTHINLAFEMMQKMYLN